MNKFKIALSVLLVAVLASGCNSRFHRDVQHESIGQKDRFIATYKADRRASFHTNSPDTNSSFCAEPPPDIATALTINASLALAKNASFDANAQLQFAKSIVEIGKVTEQIKLNRDTLYRLCELSLNRRDLESEKVYALYEQTIKRQEDTGKIRSMDANSASLFVKAKSEEEKIETLIQLMETANAAGVKVNNLEMSKILKFLGLE